MKKLFSFIIILISILNFSQNNDEILTNEKVIELKKANLSKILILNTIDESTNFNLDVSTAGLQNLTKNGIDDDIIILMMKKQKIKNQNTFIVDGVEIKEYGLFNVSNSKKTKIISHISEGNGISGMKIKVQLNKPTSEITLNGENLSFYYNFDNNEKKSENTLFSLSSTVTDPNEGHLILFNKSSKKRDLEIGRFKMTGVIMEINFKNRIDYTVTQLKENIYKIDVLKNLVPGEYGFIFGAVSPGMPIRIYDFSVN